MLEYAYFKSAYDEKSTCSSVSVRRSRIHNIKTVVIGILRAHMYIQSRKLQNIKKGILQIRECNITCSVRNGKACSALPCTARYSSALLCTPLYCPVQLYTALHCVVLLCTSLYSSVLPSTTLCCSVCSVLLCTTLHCSVLICTAVNDIVLLTNSLDEFCQGPATLTNGQLLNKPDIHI